MRQQTPTSHNVHTYLIIQRRSGTVVAVIIRERHATLVNVEKVPVFHANRGANLRNVPQSSNKELYMAQNLLGNPQRERCKQQITPPKQTRR